MACRLTWVARRCCWRACVCVGVRLLGKACWWIASCTAAAHRGSVSQEQRGLSASKHKASVGLRWWTSLCTGTVGLAIERGPGEAARRKEKVFLVGCFTSHLLLMSQRKPCASQCSRKSTERLDPLLLPCPSLTSPVRRVCRACRVCFCQSLGVVDFACCLLQTSSHDMGRWRLGSARRGASRVDSTVLSGHLCACGQCFQCFQRQGRFGHLFFSASLPQDALGAGEEQSRLGEAAGVSAQSRLANSHVPASVVHPPIPNFMMPATAPTLAPGPVLPRFTITADRPCSLRGPGSYVAPITASRPQLPCGSTLSHVTGRFASSSAFHPLRPKLCRKMRVEVRRALAHTS